MKLFWISFFCAFFLLTATVSWSAPAGQSGAVSQAKSSACAPELATAAGLYKKGDYEQAAGVLRQTIMKLGDKTCGRLWSAYNHAETANIGDHYLTTVPKNRYRVPVADFGRDYKKEGIKKYFLLDVRQPQEFVKEHIAGSLNVPFRQVLHHLDWLPKPGHDKILLIICRSQHRANHVLVIMRELGYTNAYTLQGGYHAYKKWLQQGAKPGSGPVPGTPPKAEDEEDFGC